MRMKMVKRVVALVLAMATMTTAVPVSYAQETLTASSVGTMKANASTSAVTYSSVGSAFETAYAEWSAVSGATGYNVFIKKSGGSYTQLDTMLVRQYADRFRADAVGLAAGSYTMKVVPIVNGAADESKATETSAITVEAHDRSGYAFTKGKAMGAYNADGTLKSGAIVVYVTDANKNTVSANIGGTTATGVQNIVDACQDSSVPVVIRFIGNITDPSTLDKGDLLVDKVTCGLTLEGIGTDATMNGFGIRIKNSSYVEVSNLGFMNCNSDEGDNCGFQQGNTYCWVHNCDFFYGDAGSDADQVKGDGALDTKKSQYITHSYNHFWDSGDCNLQGANGSDTSNYITYHHNWYDHSDSRHPRVRVATVHVYNNYYDGNAKYGIGSTTDSDVFVENNYFRNCYKPMIISTQGSDTEETLSGETGGMIKAFGNVIEGAGSYKPYSTNSSDFDCYDASSRTEQVPSSVTAANGGAKYSNFDTASDMYSYPVDAAEDVPSIVEAKAGRVGGGDFQWDFDDAVEDKNSEVITGLKSALIAYDDSIVAIGSGFTDSTVTPAPTDAPVVDPTDAPQNPTDAPVVVDPVEGGYVHNFTENGVSSSFYTITGNLSTSKGTVSYAGLTLTQCLKMESSTSISFTAGSTGTLTLVFAEAGSAVKIDGTKYTSDANGIVSVELAAGAHTVTKGDSMNLFYMAFSGEGGTATPTEPVVTPTEQTPTDAPTTPSSPDDVVTGDLKVISAGGWNEIAYLVVDGVNDAGVTSVSYSGPTSGTLTGDDFIYLVRDVDNGVRVDIPGLQPGTYSITMETVAGTVTKGSIVVGAQDRSGFAHFNYTAGVGAYNDNGTLKDNAVVLYVTDANKDTVTVTSKDGTTVTGIGNILNSAGQDNGSGQTSKGGTPNTNQDIIEKIAKDGTPLVIRIIGNVTAPAGLTEFDSVNYGGSEGDNGFMARMQSGKDITIEGIGTDATVNGWGIHFIAESSNPDLGESFEVRNLHFRNVPEDCLGMEGVQEDTLTAPVERCWIHNCEFYAPSISNPAESDKDGGDGACDFKRGMYFTNSYCYYEGYHKTNLVGSSDTSLQYHLTYHNNYWKDCESRGPLARQADIHMYNNVFDGQTSYCMNPRANAFIFSEYNLFIDSKDVMEVTSGGVVKSFNDTFTNCRGNAQGVIVSSRDEVVENNNLYGDFERNADLSYIPSGAYDLETDTAKLSGQFEADGGCMDETSISSDDDVIITPTEPDATDPTEPDVTDTLYGDVDCNGKVEIVDVIVLSKSLMGGGEMSAQSAANADVDKNDNVNSTDALNIMKFLVKLLESLPIA